MGGIEDEIVLLVRGDESVIRAVRSGQHVLFVPGVAAEIEGNGAAAAGVAELEGVGADLRDRE
ncbi:hypothetical protein DSECCO2_545650 [anaerobic digester metagenome]